MGRRHRHAGKISARAARGGGTELAVSPQPAPPPSLGQPDEWFGPGRPMPPMAPRDTMGRRWDFPFGQNLQIVPRFDQTISFQSLRTLADAHDLTRLCIETRKDQMSRQTWTIGIIDSEDDLTGDQKTRADRYRKMLRRPDGENFWSDWLRMVLEDMLVIDAATVFVRRTRDGEEVVGLFQIDGATIKPIVDNLGRTPQPPEAAYQQVLKGMPALNYTSREMLYRPRNRRVHTVWGMSPVEQIIATVHIALRRQIWQHAYFTSGNIPDSLIGVPSTWTPDQIRDFQDWFDSLLTGNTERRRGALFVPGEVAKSYVPTKDAEMFGGAEEWFARLVCYAFGVPHQALVKEVNRATADNARVQALEDGLAPVMNWVKSLIDGILLDQLGETELEFRWVDDKEIDPKVQDDIWAARVDRGAASRNEWRSAIGEEPRPEPEADMLTTSGQYTATPLAVDDNIAQTKAKQDAGIAPPPMDPNAAPPKPGEAKPAGGKEPPPAGPPAKEPAPVGGKVAKAAGDSRYGLISVNRRAVERQRVKLEKALTAGLKRVSARVIAAIEPVLEHIGKSAADDSAHVIEVALEALGSWQFLIDPTAEALENIVEDTVRAAAAIIGQSMDSTMVDQVSESAVEFARARAAELVGKRVLDNGDIVDNPLARWAITADTRQMLRDTITRVLEENLGSREIINELQDSFAFSPERARTISRTEVANANSHAAMESYRAARSVGVGIKKEWLIGPESCDICQENADAGAIELDDDFPSGDSESPAHPNCTCATAPVVDDGAGGEEAAAE